MENAQYLAHIRLPTHGDSFHCKKHPEIPTLSEISVCLAYTESGNIYSDFQICLYAAILITLWPFVPTGNLFHNWLNIIYFLPIGFLLHSNNKN